MRSDASYEEILREALANGCAPRLAEVLASRRFPGTRGTDRNFMEGRHLDGSQFAGLPPWVGQEYLRKAREAGVNPAGKYYSGGLARYPGDPMAWVDSLGDVKRVAEARGVEVHGAIDVVPPERDQADSGPYRVDGALVAGEVDAAIAEEPTLAPRRAELIADLADTRAGVRGG